MLKDYLNGQRIRPLDRLTAFTTQAGNSNTVLSVKDGRGSEYVRVSLQDEHTFTVGGALGDHTAQIEDSYGQVIEKQVFRVDAETELDDQGGLYRRLLQMLYLTMVNQPEGKTIRFQDRLYYVFVPWLRDHVHVMKGMKYFAPRLQDGIDLYRDSQREDGMIFDNFHGRKPAFAGPDHWSVRFDYGGFFRLFDDCSAEFTRIPVENDVEYLFLEGLYYTWKATGDDAWMSASLDAAKKALEYSVTSPYRWSEKYGLLKRGHTIDTWDFQNDEDCLPDIVGWPDPMAILPEKTRFGIMFGDNTGYAAGCRYLAEMLDHLGRQDEAALYRGRAEEIMERLNRLSWNGRFFTHHVPEDPAYQRDLGVDENSQVSLSNAYSLNRGLTHEQAAAIIRTYQQIKENLPPGSPGEWYTIYPPYLKGYGGHNEIWQYMNASVTPIVAGELAHGAFEHGFEGYGVDILQRLVDLGHQHGDVFYCSYTGAFPPPPEQAFSALDLSDQAAAPLPPGFAAGEGDLSLPVGPLELAGIPFQIHEKQAVVGIGTDDAAGGLTPEVNIPVNASAASFYLLHTITRVAPGDVVGTLTFRYADGTSATQYVTSGREVLPWSHWMYLEPGPNARAVWRGVHPQHLNLQLVVYGLDNPHPERPVADIQFQAAQNASPGAAWYLLGLTTSDQPVSFQPSPISYGIPDNWGAAAVVYALVEGLAGVVDRGVTYNQVTLAPRWSAAGVEQASVSVRYPASTGYLAYHYRHDPAARTLRLELTGSGEQCQGHLLLPPGASALRTAMLNGQPLQTQLEQIEDSYYANFTLPPDTLRRVMVIDLAYE